MVRRGFSSELEGLVGLSQRDQPPGLSDTSSSAIFKAEDSDRTNDLTDDQFENENYELRCGLINLGIGRNYVPKWTPKDAFRESYQNWKDGIIKSFNIDPRAFRPTTQETEKAITIKTYKTHDGHSSSELLGFISYEKCTGKLQLCNFNAKLEGKHLCMGESSKRSSHQLAGTHGEGLKLAALVMLRRGYGVRIESSSFYWNFSFSRGQHKNLRCKLSEPSPASLNKKKQLFAKQNSKPGHPRQLTGRTWADVTLTFSTGKGDSGRMIQEADFREWLTVALDLDPPPDGNIITTPTGDLLLGPTHSGRVYLKGLRVSGHGPDGRVYRHGYNFLSGSINRDRERLMNQLEEAEMIADIWKDAVLLEGDKITDAYLKLFKEGEDGPDTAFAERLLTFEVMRTMWRRLLAKSPGVFFFHDDYYSDTPFISQSEIITRDLKMEPQKLSKRLWKTLWKHGLARTPHQQRMHLFNQSIVIPETTETFSVTITRIMNAFLQLDSRLKTIDLRFVKGGNTQIDLLYDSGNRVLRIHEKWTRFEATHEPSQYSACDIKTFGKHFSSFGTEFVCDHVAEELVERVLYEMQGTLGLTPTDSGIIRQKTRSCIRTMPRKVATKITDNANELEVCWIGNESGIVAQRCGAEVLYLVTLHMSSTCETKKGQLLDETADLFLRPGVGRSNNAPLASPCHCPQLIVNRLDSKATFPDLDHREKYFPLVRRLESPSFYGVPPIAISPRAVAFQHGISKSFAMSSTEDTHGDTNMTFSDSDGNEAACPLPDTTPQTSTISQSKLKSSKRQKERKRRPQATPTEIRASAKADSQSPDEIQTTASRQARDIERSHSLEDLANWQVWYEDEMSLAVTKHLPNCETNPPVRPDYCSAGGDLECPRLDFTFRRDDFVRIELTSSVSAVLFAHIHDIIYHRSQSDQLSYSLLVTKYSPYSAWSILSEYSAITGSPPDTSELLLHFRNYRNMGFEADAELVEIDNIKSAGETPHDLILSGTRRLQDMKKGDLYCRFAIKTSMMPNTFCITPLAPRILRRSNDERPQTTYNGAPPPLVYDFSPQILGPSEGFQQAGCVIDCAFNFDEEHNFTWKTRYPLSSVFDGSVKPTMSEFESGNLVLPKNSSSGAAKIAVVAGEHACFRLHAENLSLPPVEQFCKPFGDILTVMASPLKPDYVVGLLSPVVLHPLAAPQFSNTIRSLVEQRFSVEIKISPIPGVNNRSERIVLVLIVSRSYTDSMWGLSETDTIAGQVTEVEAMIRDLAITNARSTEHHSAGFLCSIPAASDGEMATSSNVNVYNHDTANPPCVRDVLDKACMRPYTLGLDRKLKHPTLERTLTVREIARLQGFEDDYIFYGSKTTQYLDVLNAIPPVVSKRIAERLVQFIRTSASRKVTGGNAATPRKRVRINDPEDED